jgi:hypothetical protein
VIDGLTIRWSGDWRLYASFQLYLSPLIFTVMPSALQVLTVVEDYLLALKIKEP